MMSGLPSRPSTPGRDSAVCSRSSRSIRLPMASGRSPTPLAPRAGWSQAMIISRPSARDQRGAWSWRRRPAGSHPGPDPGLGDRSYLSRNVVPSLAQQFAEPWRQTCSTSFSRVRTSSVVGMAVEHSRRVATIAPAALAKRRIFSRSQPFEQSVAERAAEAVAGAEPVDRRHRGRRHLDDLVPGHAEHALGALLDDGDLDAGVQQRLARPAWARSRRPRPRTPPCCRSRS